MPQNQSFSYLLFGPRWAAGFHLVHSTLVR